MVATKSQQEAFKELRKAYRTGKNPWNIGSQMYLDFERGQMLKRKKKK